ncbi:unnamed protein product, partial [Caenorhabditis auriculariae]
SRAAGGGHDGHPGNPERLEVLAWVAVALQIGSGQAPLDRQARPDSQDKTAQKESSQRHRTPGPAGDAGAPGAPEVMVGLDVPVSPENEDEDCQDRPGLQDQLDKPGSPGPAGPDGQPVQPGKRQTARGAGRRRTGKRCCLLSLAPTVAAALSKSTRRRQRSISAYNQRSDRYTTPKQSPKHRAVATSEELSPLRPDKVAAKQRIISSEVKNLIFRASSASNHLAALRDPTSTYTTLHYSALKGHEQISKLLLDFEVQLAMCKDKRGCVPLHLAAWCGHFNIVKMLIAALPESVDYANSTLETPMHLAAQHGHGAIVKLLLEKRANPTLRNVRGEGPLDIAARLGHAEVCNILARNVPELTLQSAAESSSTTLNEKAVVVYPLHAAARNSHIECLQVLRNNGFDINFVTEEGSALHVAAIFGQVKAVRYLIREGINTDICNSRGQTALEALTERESQGGSEVTQIIQSRDGWAECRRLIEEGTKRLQSDQLNSSSDSGIDRRDSERFTRRSQSNENDRDVIWKQLPTNASVHYQDQRKQVQRINSPLYLNADLRGASPGGSTADLSTMSDTTHAYPSTTLNRTWNSRMYDSGGVPRFPITSPYNKSRHNASQRTSDTLPVNFSGVRTKPVNPRGSILPQQGSDVYRAPPPQYNVWQQSRAAALPNYPSNGPSAMGYDNVPKNSLVYENAFPQERPWDQVCTGSIGRAMANQLNELKIHDGTQTLPAGRIRARVPIGQTFSPIAEQAINSPGSAKLNRPRINGSRTTCDREESLGLTNSPRLDTRASSVVSSLTFACSTLERGGSPSIRSMQQGRAPLAMPEELTGSTTNSLMSNSMNSDRESRENSVTIIANYEDAANGSKVPGEHFEKASSPGSPPSPNTSQAVIFDALYGSTAPRGRRLSSNSKSAAAPLSPAGTDCSDSTMASSCSLQMISQISHTPPSVKSPTRNDANLLGSEVRLRPEFRSPDSTSSKTTSGSSRSINMAEEWKQIDEILASYGAAPCRESVFMREYEPQVAVFLRDRRSQALTLQLVNSPLNTRPNSIELDKERRQPTNILSVPEWLEMKVGLPSAVARDIGALLVKYGFDSCNQLKGSLTWETLAALNIPEPIQMHIMHGLDVLEDRNPEAYTFYYVSDWLCSLDLTSYLGNFLNEGFKSMKIIRGAEITKPVLKKLGVELPGHMARILYSLRRGEEIEAVALNKTSPRKNNHSEYARLEKETLRSKNSESPDPELGRRDKLMSDGVLFSAHFLGKTEISNIDGTDESRRVMEKMKKAIRDIVNVPQVFLEISVDGVRILDSVKKSVMAVHEVSRIQIVCQDERDLNCFTYITQDNEKNFCHVFLRPDSGRRHRDHRHLGPGL